MIGRMGKGKSGWLNFGEIPPYIVPERYFKGIKVKLKGHGLRSQGPRSKSVEFLGETHVRFDTTLQ